MAHTTTFEIRDLDFRRRLEIAHTRQEPLVLQEHGQQIGLFLPWDKRAEGVPYLIGKSLEELVQGVLEQLDGALQEYEDLESRVVRLERFRQQLQALWPVSHGRADRFQNLQLLILDALQSVTRWGELSRAQIAALRSAAAWLREDEVTWEMVQSADRTLLQHSLNSLPEIDHLEPMR
jgi:transposase